MTAGGGTPVESTLQSIEEQVGRLISLMPTALYTCDAEGRLTFFNRRAAEIWGREPRLGHDGERFCGALRIWLPDGFLLPHEECPMADAVRNARGARDVEIVIEQPTGKRLATNMDIDPLHDAGGRFVGTINVFTDVTERRLAETRLQDREAALARVQRIGAVGGLDINVAGGMRSWRSPEYLQLHGLAPGTREETHEQWRERVHPDDRDHAERMLFAALESGGRTYESEYRIIRPSDGKVRWIHARADIERAPDGKPVRLLGAHVDVTEQKQMQEALRQSKERQAFLLRLSDALRPIADPMEVQRVAMRCLGEQLRVDRALYYRAEPSEYGFLHIVDSEYFSRPGIVSVAGTPRANRDYGAGIFAGLETGERMQVDDLWADPHIGAAERERYAALGLRAFIAVPVLKDGQYVGGVSAQTAEPRQWTAAEVELVAEVTERTWAAVERAQAQAALREKEASLRRSEERLHKFGEASQDILWIRDAATLQWQYLTPAFEAIYGLTREEALSGDNYSNWLDLVLPEDRRRVEKAIGRVREGEHVTFDYRVRRPADGSIRWLRNTDFPITGPEGEVKLIGGVGHDLTGFQETKLRLQTLLEGIPQLVWRAVDSGQWTWCSPQWTAYTGLTLERSLRFGWLEAVHPDDREVAIRFWDKAARLGRLEMEGRIRHAGTDEYHWFQTRATPVRDEGGGVIEWLGTSTDIHEMRALQERQKVLVGELQHRTRNLLGVVRSMAEKTVQTSSDLPDFRLRFRDRLDALSRVQSLLSRLDEHDRVTFDEMIRTEFSAMDGNDKVTLSGPMDVRLRSSTVQILAMALHELATNAMKYGALVQSAGRLAVTWALEPEGDGGKPWLHIEWHESRVEMPPPGAAPRGTGQGRELIEHALPYQLGARTTYVMGPDGVRCTISIPVSASTVP